MFKPTFPEPLPPQHRNLTLQEKIASKQGKSELRLYGMGLTDQDTEIVVYYVLRENKVIYMAFAIVVRA